MKWETNRRNVALAPCRINRLLPTGVQYSGKRFKAVIVFEKKYIYLGTFGTPEKASEIYKLAVSEIDGGIFVPQKWPRRWRLLPVGVDRIGRRFRASIRVNKKYIHLGMFDSSEAASEACRLAKKGG